MAALSKTNDIYRYTYYALLTIYIYACGEKDYFQSIFRIRQSSAVFWWSELFRKQSDFFFYPPMKIQALTSWSQEPSRTAKVRGGCTLGTCTNSQVLTGIVSILLGQLGMGKLMLLFPAPVTSGTSANEFAEAAKEQKRCQQRSLPKGRIM